MKSFLLRSNIDFLSLKDQIEVLTLSELVKLILNAISGLRLSIRAIYFPDYPLNTPGANFYCINPA